MANQSLKIKDYKYQDVINFKVASSAEARAPVNVMNFVSHILLTLLAAWPGKLDGMKLYIEHLYQLIVWDGKTFKNGLPGGKTILVDEVSSESFAELNIEGIEHNAACFYADPESTVELFYVARGDSDNSPTSKSFYPEIKAVVINDRELQLPVMSFKLTQAVISILCTLLELSSKMMPAKLGANVIAGCLIPACNVHGWGVHAHSGLNFVANFVQAVSRMKSDKARLISGNAALEDIYTIFMQRLTAFPALDEILMMAFRMDELSFANSKKKDPKNTEPINYSTLRAIEMTCNISLDNLKIMSSKLNPAKWGIQGKKRSDLFIQAFTGIMNSKSGAKSTETADSAPRNANSSLNVTDILSKITLNQQK